MSEIKAFTRWDIDGIKIDDPGLKDYITVKPQIVPRSGARYAGSRFHKSKVFIVERLMNKIMVAGHKSKKHNKSSGHCTGKGHKVYDIMEAALTIVEERIKENPIKVLVKAIENAAQREEITTIEYGGARYPKVVECAPQRRVDLVLRHLAQGAYTRSFKKKRDIASCLAEEIILAYKASPDSHAISKKLDVERQADSSR